MPQRVAGIGLRRGAGLPGRLRTGTDLRTGLRTRLPPARPEPGRVGPARIHAGAREDAAEQLDSALRPVQVLLGGPHDRPGWHRRSNRVPARPGRAPPQVPPGGP
ncbi:hypothetical protein Ae168Ps1_3674c [Pseudonocardia sp. Ae168_Ps1]|nr:hypothetical protein Ae150APs1_3651c [Pseudonocardia sp. Ae150A_Ps1]OLL81268.1 hypothetical protein Ae168Ps1_3674c [Pseudonocardia sp. Ae168_Ps1]OLL84618.1 hypothetical protein Ae263Ps1_1673 [Pseudonocardia sp. Ae263_Ps1]